MAERGYTAQEICEAHGWGQDDLDVSGFSHGAWAQLAKHEQLSVDDHGRPVIQWFDKGGTNLWTFYAVDECGNQLGDTCYAVNRDDLDKTINDAWDGYVRDGGNDYEPV